MTKEFKTVLESPAIEDAVTDLIQARCELFWKYHGSSFTLDLHVLPRLESVYRSGLSGARFDRRGAALAFEDMLADREAALDALAELHRSANSEVAALFAGPVVA